MDRSKSPAQWLALWIGLALLLRLAWVLHLPVSDAQIAALADQREYLDLGRNLLHGRGLYFHDPRFDADVWAYRTPGYPIFIALCGGSIRAIRLAQAFIDASNALAVYLLARQWLSFRRALFAAALVAINPLLIYFSGLILAETLFTALLIWGMVLVTSRKAAWKWRARGLLLLALSVLVRPSALALPLFLAALNPFWLRTYHWPRMVAAGAMLFVLLFPWALRNRLRLGSWVWTTTNGGITMYDGFNPAADGSSDQSFITQIPGLKNMGEVRRSEYFLNLARKYVREHPARVQVLTFNKVVRTWSPVPLSQEYGHNWRYVAIGLFFTLPLFLLTIAGIMSNHLPMAAKVLLLLPALYITVIHAASVGSIRYRVPADVPMAIVAAAGAGFFRRKTESAAAV
jgi:4-amino-4-deoxy-L-arabinose transferase-like glycosyltransferase